MQSTDPGIQAAFLWRLSTATEGRKVEWEAIGPPKESESYIFSTTIGRFFYVIQSLDSDDLPPYKFEIRSFDESHNGGRGAEPIMSWSSQDGPMVSSPLISLYHEVKRQVSGHGTVVRDMFSDLANIDGGPAEPSNGPF